MTTLKVPVTADDHVQGDHGAPVTLVEYGDYECPVCGRAFSIVQRVQKHFGKRLLFVFRNFPLSEIHPQAEAAAETAEFAAAGNRFWEMHDAIFENQQSLGLARLFELVAELELPTAELEAALSAHEFRARVKADFLGGVRSGVNGTPTFFINGRRHDGPFEYEDLARAIESCLEHRTQDASGP